MRKHITVEKVILFLAALFAAYNFGLAGGFIEKGHAVLGAGGMIAGLVVNVSLAIAASRYGSLNGKNRTRQANIAFPLMLFLSVIIVSPVVYYSLPETFLWPLGRVLWSLAWPLVADLAIVLAGAVSGKGLISLSDESTKKSETSATDSPKSASGVRRSASHSATESVGVRRTYPRKCDYCDAQIASPNAVGGHMKKRHPELCKTKGILAEALFKQAGER